MNEPTRDGAKLIEAWMAAETRLKRAKDQVNSAQCDLENTKNALGCWMVPEDIKVDETLCVWFGDSLIAVTKTDSSGNGTFHIDVRKRGRSL